MKVAAAPGGELVVDTIGDDAVKNRGVPAATAWNKVRMRPVAA
jgi:hypothetical protein